MNTAASPAPSSLAGTRLRVLELATTPAGVRALVGVTARSGAGLVVLSSPTGVARWSVSAEAHLPGADHLASVGSTPSGGVFAVLANRSGAEILELLATPSSSWELLPELPGGTATVAVDGSGRIDALSESGSVMKAYRLDEASRAWRLIQTLKVAILYGSSG